MFENRQSRSMRWSSWTCRVMRRRRQRRGQEEMQRIMAHTHRLPLTNPADGRGHTGRPGRGVASGVDMFDCVMPTRNAQRQPHVHALVI
jgi:tRNA-guanine family transglycosylase